MSGRGIYNCATVKYSPETRKILQDLLEESKLSIYTQRKINDSILNGTPLPKARAQSAPPQSTNLFGLKKNYYFSRRSERQIKESGAYEIEPMRTLRPIRDRGKEKEQLQNQMAFGNKCGEIKKKITVKEVKPITRQGRIDELLAEIQDRIEFLERMGQLGQAHRYERDMKQEIAAKLRELRDVQSMSDFSFSFSLKNNAA